MANKTERLAELYKRASVLDENLPAQLMDKLSIYGQILELLGGFHASSVEVWKLAEANRREVIGSTEYYGPEYDGKSPKTGVEKSALGEILGAEARRNEGKAEAEAIRWKNAYNSTIEQINIMKKRYDHLCNVLMKGGI